MEQKHRKLLLKDLGSRLYCGVKVTTNNPAVKLGIVSGISIEGKITVSTKHADIVFDVTEVKPYLRSMSSMTEKEAEEYRNIDNRSYSCPIDYAHIPASERIDWLNAHKFDYRGLIPNLAIEAPNDMYKI